MLLTHGTARIIIIIIIIIIFLVYFIQAGIIPLPSVGPPRLVVKVLSTQSEGFRASVESMPSLTRSCPTTSSQ